MKKRGFTLIELLIVVAIIAILAAIAVPNFLEAQVRSKVSRVLADMRSITVAIEAYSVDYSKYPPDAYDPGAVGGWPDVLNIVTTPVAYMTSIPIDPFITHNKTQIGSISYWYVTKTGFWTHRDGDHPMNGPASLFYGPRNQYMWCLDSPAPDQFWEWDRAPGGYISGQSKLPYGGDVLFYDTTNGTKSQGDLYYFGPGGGINPPPHPGSH